MELKVTRQAMGRMMAEARAALPRECCGILLGRGDRIDTAVPAANVHPTPERFFEIAPEALIAAHRTARKGGPEVIGYYHSHPSGVAEPSATDRAQAAGDGLVWAIVGRVDGSQEHGAETVQFWRDAKDGFQRLSYAATDS